MEAATGHDYGDVQVHTDGAAAASAKSVQAHAYTVGNHVVFGEGRYQPDTAEGRHTLAHELTHVVQQRQGPVDGTDAAGGIKLSDPGDRFEREAESVASKLSSGPGGDAPTAAGGAGAAPVQRHEDTGDEPPVQRQAAGGEEEVEEAPGAEAAAPAPEAAAEAPAEAPPEEQEEEPTVSKLDEGVAVQRQGEDENEDEGVTQE
jgi:hypothetical protein